MTRLEDLPPAVQREISAGKSRRAGPAQRPLPARGRRGRSGGRFTCGQCGAIFWAYTPAEKHIDLVHHSGRLEWSDC